MVATLREIVGQRVQFIDRAHDKSKMIEMWVHGGGGLDDCLWVSS
jgi:hypothetical protein